MQRTKIEYLTHTWNPIVMRCSKASESCENCWHLRVCDRMRNNPIIDLSHRQIYAGFGIPTIRPDELEAPLRLKKPARIGVQFMGDLFHEDVRSDQIDGVFEIMLQAPQHTYLVLTKRPRRLYDWADLTGNREELIWKTGAWIGVSCENQARADERIPILLRIPAAVRWVSLEPCLSKIDLTPWLNSPPGGKYEGKRKGISCSSCDGMEAPFLNFVIIGQETGPGARPAKAEWFIDIIEQCRAASVPVFIKASPAGVPIIREFPR